MSDFKELFTHIADIKRISEDTSSLLPIPEKTTITVFSNIKCSIQPKSNKSEYQGNVQELTYDRDMYCDYMAILEGDTVEHKVYVNGVYIRTDTYTVETSDIIEDVLVCKLKTYRP